MMAKGWEALYFEKRVIWDLQEEPVTIRMLSLFWLRSLRMVCQLFWKMVLEVVACWDSVPKLPLMPQQPAWMMFRVMPNLEKMFCHVLAMLGMFDCSEQCNIRW